MYPHKTTVGKIFVALQNSIIVLDCRKDVFIHGVNKAFRHPGASTFSEIYDFIGVLTKQSIGTSGPSMQPTATVTPLIFRLPINNTLWSLLVLMQPPHPVWCPFSLCHHLLQMWSRNWCNSSRWTWRTSSRNVSGRGKCSAHLGQSRRRSQPLWLWTMH